MKPLPFTQRFDSVAAIQSTNLRQHRRHLTRLRVVMDADFPVQVGQFLRQALGDRWPLILAKCCLVIPKGCFDDQLGNTLPLQSLPQHGLGPVSPVKTHQP